VETKNAMLKLRIDVDYPYTSRAKSFLCIALGVKTKSGNSYLKNSRIIARMVNETQKPIRAYWFFTPYTIPDKSLLGLLNSDKHEIGLHVATNPLKELKILKNETDRTVQYYTIHGTERVIARLIWGRRLSEKQAQVPGDFPLKSFHDPNTFGIDAVRSYNDGEEVKKAVRIWIEKGFIVSIHPEWLFTQNKRGQRGDYYEVLKSILDVDKDIETVHVNKHLFANIGHDIKEYSKNIVPTKEFLQKLDERDIDVFTFLDRKWCCPLTNPPSNWIGAEDNIGLLEIKDYDSWWQNVDKKTRNVVRKAEKSGVKVTVVEPSDRFAEGISKIYNETPIRQERAFPHFGEPLVSVAGNMYVAAKDSTFIGAYIENELVGYIQLLYGDNIAIISQILSMQKHWDKSVNNALLAKAVEVCASKGQRWLMYGRIGNHPSLDKFKENNGFVKFPITRYYIPITGKGKLAVNLGLHRELKDALPQSIKSGLIPILNWASRTKMRLKNR
jgi:hypothetical protein